MATDEVLAMDLSPFREELVTATDFDTPTDKQQPRELFNTD